MIDRFNIEHTFAINLSWNDVAACLSNAIGYQLSLKSYTSETWAILQSNDEHVACLRAQSNLSNRICVVILQPNDFGEGPNAIVLRFDGIISQDYKFKMTDWSSYKAAYNSYYSVGDNQYTIEDVLSANFSEHVKSFCLYNLDRVT